MGKQKIIIYHSPDSDDAFMFYGLVCGAVQGSICHYEHALKDIESLNHLAMAKEVDVTAVSVHAYSKLKEDYRMLSCGGSFGGVDYGPKIVTKPGAKIYRKIAVPGTLTSATLALKLYLLDVGLSVPELVVIPFTEIEEAVLSGKVDAGVIIHEGQLTYQHSGLIQAADLGAWWWEREQLPLPLGINIVKRSLGEAIYKEVGTILKGSIQYALSHRKEAIQYALEFGRGLTESNADRFIAMYVNDITVDMGQAGEMAIQRFLAAGTAAGFC